MSEHTPGPWSLREDELASGWFVDGAGHPLAFVDHSHANAALIAAAPELLEAAEAVIYDYRHDGDNLLGDALFDPLRSAIAKAKGESQ